MHADGIAQRREAPAPSPPSSPAKPGHQAYRFTVTEYHRLAEAGTFKHQRVELLDGVIYEMNAMGTPHKWAMKRLLKLLMVQVPESHALMSQLPLKLSRFSEPEPDFCIAPESGDPRVWPGGKDVSLVIEVSDSTLETDLGEKAELYAKAGVREYWVVDLQRGAVVVHLAPKGRHYTKVLRRERAETVVTSFTPRIKLTLSDVLR